MTTRLSSTACCTHNRVDDTEDYYRSPACPNVSPLANTAHLHSVLELRPLAVYLQHGDLGLLERCVGFGPEARRVLETGAQRQVVKSRAYLVVLRVSRIL